MIRIFDAAKELAETVAAEMKEQLVKKENPVFCLAAGGTTAETLRQFSEWDNLTEYIEKLGIVSLDEWVGVSKDIDGSCYQMLNKDLFSRVPLKEEQIHFFDAMNENLEAECRRIDAYIEEHPITFSLMGVGMNGHIGLNEPGDELRDHSAVIPLSETTKVVGQKYFADGFALESGMTLGLKQIMNSERVVVAIVGAHKKEIVKKIFTENEGVKLSVQELLGKDNIDFYIDKEAYSLME